MRLYSFDKVITPTKRYVVSAIVNEFPKFSIMSGDSGTGKSTCAEISALRLTCLNPNGYNPCGECPNCKSGIAHIEGKGDSLFLKKLNIAKQKGNINDIINEVFRLETSQKSVYIFEEVHSLSHDAQTALLEEIDKTPPNVYIIMCTTKSGRLLPELRNRAISFKFRNLNKTNSRILLDIILKSRGYGIPSKSQELILEHAMGSPRVITMLVEFIHQNGYDYDMLLEYLDEMDYRVFTELITNVGSITNFMSLLNDMLAEYDRDSIIKQLKGYLLDSTFLLKGVPRNETRLSTIDNSVVKTLDFNTLAKLYSKLMSGKFDSNDDFIFFMVFIFRPALANKMNVSTNVVEEHQEALESRESMSRVEIDDNNKSKKLTLTSLEGILGK